MTPFNDVLLMQRLIEASASRELLVQELAAVIFENFSVEQVIICRIDETGKTGTNGHAGYQPQRSRQALLRLDGSMSEAVTRLRGGYLLRICDNTRNPIVVYIRADESLNIGRLQPLLKQAELGFGNLLASGRRAKLEYDESWISACRPLCRVS